MSRNNWHTLFCIQEISLPKMQPNLIQIHYLSAPLYAYLHNTMRHLLTTITAIILGTATIYAQEIDYHIDFNAGYSNGNYTPFWHISNRQGVGSMESQSGYMRAAIAGEKRINDSWRVNYGADFIMAHNHTSTVYVQQAFTDIGWRMFILSLGQKERWSNFKNQRLTTGGLTESGNARPIPQIRFEVPQYWDIFGTNGWFTVRGHIAYGWFTDESWQKDFTATGNERTTGVRYHSKAGYFKVGNEKKFPLTYEFGLEMVAQFGGTVYNRGNNSGECHHNPVKLKDYIKIFFMDSGDGDYHGMDQANVAGNHLGSWHTALTWHGKDYNIKGYYEHTFEDHSQMFWEYGLWNEQLVGIELEFKEFNWIKNIAVEYFNLKNHSGPIYHDSTDKIPDQISCGDNNYNHEWYTGWFNYGMIIGSPLCTSPIYNNDSKLVCYNNRVEAFHFAIEGEPCKGLGYRLLLTKSNNWGTYSDPFTDIKENLSGYIELRYKPAKLEGWSVAASFAFDDGNLYGNNNGGMLTIRKEGILKF